MKASAGLSLRLSGSSVQAKRSKSENSTPGASPTRAVLGDLNSQEIQKGEIDSKFCGVPLEDFDSHRNDVSLLSMYLK